MTTIYDVARSAGVSPTTVSRVLNTPRAVAANTVVRVRRAIDELGFRPSLQARDLRLRSSHTIGLLVGDISQPFDGALTKSVARAAEGSGYAVMVGDLDRCEHRLLDYLDTMPSRGPAGVLLATADHLDKPATRDAVRRLEGCGIPVVTMARVLPAAEAPAVGFDYRQIGIDAARHLLDTGSGPLVALGGGPESSHSRALQAGMRAAARAVGVEVHLANGRFRYEPARAAVARLLARGVRPGGVIAANATMAMGAIRALGEAHVDVPTDSRVVVCEDVPCAEHHSPSLTAIDADPDDYGAVAVDILLRRVTGQPVPATTVLPHSLRIRESSAGVTPRP